MTSDRRRTTTPEARTPEDRPEREREQDRSSEREGRISAEQIAAPPTRRWRRPERSQRPS